MSIRAVMADKLKEFREAAGLTPQEVAERLGKSDKTIYAWEKGRGQPDADMLIKLCRMYGVDISDFYYRDNASRYEYAVIDFSKKYPGMERRREEQGRQWVVVPLYGSIAAGTPLEMDAIDDTFVIPYAIHKKYPQAFLLKVVGESMNKKLPNGSYALVNPTTEVVDGNAYAVCVNGYDATIKRVRKLANGFELSPDSTDPTIKSRIYDYGEEGTETVTVIGEVVWCVYPFDYEI